MTVRVTVIKEHEKEVILKLNADVSDSTDPGIDNLGTTADFYDIPLDRLIRGGLKAGTSLHYTEANPAVPTGVSLGERLQGTRKVNINAYNFNTIRNDSSPGNVSGSGAIEVYRRTGSEAIDVNGTRVLVFPAGFSEYFHLEEHDMSDNELNEQNIRVRFITDGQLYLTLRKLEGYKTNVQLAQYGAHDDPTKDGSKED